MPLSRSRRLLNKSISAMISAIEIYNKPDHKYREETFSILALNAWELLFKAYVLENNENLLTSIYVYERKQLKNGGKSQKKYLKRNRANNPMTIGLNDAIKKIELNGYDNIHSKVKENIEGLSEIRDNAVHYTNTNIGLSKIVQELGSATLQNYIKIIKKWFDYDLGHYNFYLMPLAFFRTFNKSTLVNLTNEEKNIILYLTEMNEQSNESDGYNVLLELDISLKRSNTPADVRISYGNDPNAVPITLVEEDIRGQYPWDYRELTEKLKNRYINFKENSKYHSIRTPLKKDQKYVMQRYLDPGNPNSSKKDFYSPNVLNVFDRCYKRKSNSR